MSLALCSHSNKLRKIFTQTHKAFKEHLFEAIDGSDWCTELVHNKIIYDIRNPKLSHNINGTKLEFSNTLSRICKRLKRNMRNNEGLFDSLCFSTQADLYFKFQEIFSTRLFDTVRFRQIWYLLWRIIWESYNEVPSIELSNELLYSIILYSHGKAIAPTKIWFQSLTNLNLFPLHQAIFQNNLSQIRPLLQNQV